MKRINLYDAIEFKKIIKNQFGIDVHWHDGCGGQYFELEATNDLIIEFIESFSQDKKHVEIKFLDINEEPKMKLCGNFDHNCAVEYCNIHGLWKGEK